MRFAPSTSTNKPTPTLTHHHHRRTSASINSSRPATPTPSYTPTCTPWDEWLHEPFPTTDAQAPSTTPAKPSHAIPSQAGAKPPPSVSVSLAHTSSGDAINPLHLPLHACTPRADHPLVPSALHTMRHTSANLSRISYPLMVPALVHGLGDQQPALPLASTSPPLS